MGDKDWRDCEPVRRSDSVGGVGVTRWWQSATFQRLSAKASAQARSALACSSRHGAERRPAPSVPTGTQPASHFPYRQPPTPTAPHVTVQRLNAASRYSRFDYSPNPDEGRYYSAKKILAGRLHVRPSNPDLEARGC